MKEKRRPKASDTTEESIQKGLEDGFETTDEKNAKTPPRQTRAVGEMQRDPKRTIREAPKPSADGSER